MYESKGILHMHFITRTWNSAAGFNYSDFAKLREKMKACNAFTDNPSQYQLLDPREIGWFIDINAVNNQFYWQN